MDKKPPHQQLIWNTIQKTRIATNQPPFQNKTSANPPLFNHPPSTIPSSNPQKNNPSPYKVKLALNKDCSILVKPSNSTVATILAKLPGSSYDLKLNQWSFPIDSYELVIGLFIKNKLIFDKIPNGTIKLARKNFNNNTYPLSGGIFDLLMDFQREAVSFAINRNGRILLADDMGLGKTIQALAIAQYYKLEFPLLVICPASLCYNWADSIKQFLNEEASIIHDKSDLDARIAVVSYNAAVTYISHLHIFPVVICDECHYLKSRTSKRTISLLPVLQKASRVVMISGTPATSRPVELYPVLCALDKSLYPVFHEYGSRYCNGRKIGNYFDYRGCSNAIELGTVIEKAFMIRRLKGEVLKQLPMKFRRQVILDAGVKRKNEKKGILGKVIGEPDLQIMQEYREAAGIKKEAVIKYLEEIIEKGVKSLVFGHHKEMLEAIEEFCKEKRVRFIRIDGGTASVKRQELVEQFQNEEDVRIAVLSLTACSTGLTLTSGKAVIFAELYWNPGTMLQAEDRIHRIGQRENVDVHYLIAKDTIDEVVWPKLIEKLTVLESLGMSKNELKGVEEDTGQGRLGFRKMT